MRDRPPKDHTPRTAPRPARRKFAPLAPADTARTAPRPAPLARAPARDPDAPQRIAKVIARAGACSRRDAEAWIGEGRVALNGVVLENPAVNVTPADDITIDGAPLAARARTRLFLFHKPRGLVTTERDPEGRRTIFDHLRDKWPDAPRLVSVGRLDINTEGLLLLTNDGGLARVLELPATGWVRRYRVRANGATDQAALDGLRHGVTVDGVAYAEIEATLDRAQGANCWLTMGLREGKNREVKRVLEHLGLEVNRLIRLSFGPFQLGDLVEGALEEVKTRVLRDQLGPALAAAAGVDFSGPAGDAAETAAPAAPRSGRDAARQVRASRGADDALVRRPRPETGAPRRERPSEAPPRERAEARAKPPPAPRKHISALRGEPEPGGGRKRTLRSATADRAGRTVPVERRVAVERPARGERTDKRRDRAGAAEPASRNARRFEALRRESDGALPSRRPDRVEERSEGRSKSGTRAPATRWRDDRKAGASSRDAGPSGGRSASRRPESRRPESRSPESRSPAGGKSGGGRPSQGHDGRGERPRGPYDPAKDRSRIDERGGARGAPARFDRPARAEGGRSGKESQDRRGAARTNARADRPGARPSKPGGPEFAPRGARSGASRKNSGPGFRGGDKRPGGGGKPGGGGGKPGRGKGQPGGAGGGRPPRDKS